MGCCCLCCCALQFHRIIRKTQYPIFTFEQRICINVFQLKRFRKRYGGWRTVRTTDRLMKPKQRERETAKERAKEAFTQTLISFCTEKLTAPIFCVIFNVIFICTTYRIQTLWRNIAVHHTICGEYTFEYRRKSRRNKKKKSHTNQIICITWDV